MHPNTLPPEHGKIISTEYEGLCSEVLPIKMQMPNNSVLDLLYNLIEI